VQLLYSNNTTVRFSGNPIRTAITTTDKFVVLKYRPLRMGTMQNIDASSGVDPSHFVDGRRRSALRYRARQQDTIKLPFWEAGCKTLTREGKDSGENGCFHIYYVVSNGKALWYK
jgi:hypothetical protein